MGGESIVTLTGWTHPLHTNTKRKCVSILCIAEGKRRWRTLGAERKQKSGMGGERIVTLTGWTHHLHTNTKRTCVSILCFAGARWAMRNKLQWEWGWKLTDWKTSCVRAEVVRHKKELVSCHQKAGVAERGHGGVHTNNEKGVGVRTFWESPHKRQARPKCEIKIVSFILGVPEQSVTNFNGNGVNTHSLKKVG